MKFRRYPVEACCEQGKADAKPDVDGILDIDVTLLYQ